MPYSSLEQALDGPMDRRRFLQFTRRALARRRPRSARLRGDLAHAARAAERLSPFRRDGPARPRPRATGRDLWTTPGTATRSRASAIIEHLAAARMPQPDAHHGQLALDVRQGHPGRLRRVLTRPTVTPPCVGTSNSSIGDGPGLRPVLRADDRREPALPVLRPRPAQLRRAARVDRAARGARSCVMVKSVSRGDEPVYRPSRRSWSRRSGRGRFTSTSTASTRTRLPHTSPVP